MLKLRSGFALLLLFLGMTALAQESVTIVAKSYSGTAYDIGYQIGKDALRDNPYFGMMLKAEVFTKATPQNYAEVTRLLREYDPALLEEMRGFAEATSLSVQDIVVELSGYGITTTPIDRGCTQLAVGPANTANHHSFAGRNYDFTPDKILSDFRLYALYPAASQLASIGSGQFFFGRVEGMNEAGLYVGMSFANGQGRSQEGFFFPLIVRMTLDTCSSAAQAVDFLKKVPHSFAYNYLVADATEAFAVEVSPPRVAVRPAKNQQLVVANHYASEELKPFQKKVLPNSFLRNDIASAGLAGVKDLPDLEKLLASPLPQGLSLSYYQNKLGTIWSAVFDLTDRRVFYAVGSPTINDYQEFKFAGKEAFNKVINGKLPASQPFPK